MVYSTLFIDLDETLYSTTCGVWDAISERMERYMHERLNLPRAEIPALRKELYQKYGTTLRGLKMTRQVNEREFLDYVHDVPIDQFLQPDAELRAALLRYPLRRIIFTNADRNHAGRVLRQLGLEDCFDRTIDIYDIAPYCKPMTEAFQIALALCGEPVPEKCVFIDDSPNNLAAARALGFYTVQVGPSMWSNNHLGAGSHVQISRLADLPSVLAPG